MRSLSRRNAATRTSPMLPLSQERRTGSDVPVEAVPSARQGCPISRPTPISTGLSNARSEGYNRIAKHVGRIAFGFRTPENQRRRVRWACTRQSRRASSGARHLRPC